MQQPKKDTEEYYKYWEDRGYEFVEGRTVDTKTGNTKFIWIKRKVINLKNTFKDTN
jgi:hypothetical protein